MPKTIPQQTQHPVQQLLATGLQMLSTQLNNNDKIILQTLDERLIELEKDWQQFQSTLPSLLTKQLITLQQGFETQLGELDNVLTLTQLSELLNKQQTTIDSLQHNYDLQNQALHALQTTLDEQTTTISSLTTQVESYQATVTTLLKQVQTLLSTLAQK